MFDKTETLQLHIEGMSCGHCVKRVEAALKAQKGVKSAVVELAPQRATVTYIPAKVTADELAAAVTAAGYPARRD